jgi:hypothetical protein
MKSILEVALEILESGEDERKKPSYREWKRRDIESKRKLNKIARGLGYKNYKEWQPPETNEEFIMENKMDAEAKKAHKAAEKAHGPSLPEAKFKNRDDEDHHVKLGDHVGFKSDHEQYGQVVHIKRHPYEGYHLTLHNPHGFGGEYLRYKKTTQEHSGDVWK